MINKYTKNIYKKYIQKMYTKNIYKKYIQKIYTKNIYKKYILIVNIEYWIIIKIEK